MDSAPNPPAPSPQSPDQKPSLGDWVDKYLDRPWKKTLAVIAGVSILMPAITWGLDFINKNAKRDALLDGLDSKIKFAVKEEVGISIKQINDVVKDAELYRASWDTYHAAKALEGTRDYKNALQHISRFRKSTEWNKVPEHLRRFIFETYIGSLVGLGDFALVKQSEIQEIEALLFNTEGCSRNLHDLATCYLALGNRSKAKQIATLGIERQKESQCGSIIDLYTIIIFCDLANHNESDMSKRFENAWATLMKLNESVQV